MKKIRKCRALAVLLLLVLLLSACSGKSSDDENTVTEKSGDVTETTTLENEDASDISDNDSADETDGTSAEATAETTAEPDTTVKETEAEKSEYEVLVEEGILQYPTSNDEYEYNVYDTYIELTHYIGNDTVVDIPSEIDGLPVLVIGGTTFDAWENYDYEDYHAVYEAITSVTFPEHLVEIDSGAFGRCTSLKEADLPEGLVSIGNYSFFGCTSLSEINLPDTLRSTGVGTFYKCTALVSITIPAGMEELGDYAFEECTALETVVIEGGRLTVVSEESFAYCNALKSVTIGEGVVKIESDAFHDCKSITELSLPETLQYIESDAFWLAFDPDGSIDIVLPESVTSVGNGAFTGVSKTQPGIASITVLNPECYLSSTICSDQILICGYAASTAAKYCAENGNTFQLLE